jgi:hypothetical protein
MPKETRATRQPLRPQQARTLNPETLTTLGLGDVKALLPPACCRHSRELSVLWLALPEPRGKEGEGVVHVCVPIL